MPRPFGQGSAVLSGRVISPAFVYCQRQSSTKCRIATHSTTVRDRTGIAVKDRPFHRFPPHLSHIVATFWVKNMQCFGDCPPSQRSGSSRSGEPDEDDTALCPR